MNSFPYTVRLWFPTRRVEAATEDSSAEPRRGSGPSPARLAASPERYVAPYTDGASKLRCPCGGRQNGAVCVSHFPTQAHTRANTIAYENSLQSLRIRREDMPRRTLLAAVSSISLATVVIPAVAADV